MELVVIVLVGVWMYMVKARVGRFTDSLIAKDNATGASGTLFRWFGS